MYEHWCCLCNFAKLNTKMKNIYTHQSDTTRLLFTNVRYDIQ